MPNTKFIAAQKVKLTAGRVAAYQCEAGKPQSFLWDTDTPGLALRATSGGTKTYVFQSKFAGKSLRVAIGGVHVWGIEEARAEARRLQILLDQGKDPRQVKADEIAADKARKEAAQELAAEAQRRETREAVTVGAAWDEYIAERRPYWSDLHLRDHQRMIQAGGERRTRSKKLTEPGPLAALANVRLIDLTPERVEVWARSEVPRRATRAQLALRLLKAFLNWCASHPVYGEVCTVNAAKSRKAREILGKPRVKHDVLQREQLPAWFAAVRRIRNPVISAYLQCMLFLGPRRNELAALRWADVDFQWNSLILHDKVDDFREVSLTPYVAQLLTALPRRDEWVFSSPTAASEHIEEPSIAHRKACAIAGIELTLHGLRRSLASLSEWVEMPAGIAAQIQGHAPQGVRERHYIRRSLDLLRVWHTKLEAWILEQAGIDFVPLKTGLRVVGAAG